MHGIHSAKQIHRFAGVDGEILATCMERMELKRPQLMKSLSWHEKKNSKIKPNIAFGGQSVHNLAMNAGELGGISAAYMAKMEQKRRRLWKNCKG